MRALLGTLAVFALALCSHAGITQKDFTGLGNIYVLESENWSTASPTEDRIGCLSEQGKLIPTKGKAPCGVFTRKESYPYTLSTKKGNCTFNDESQERNTDSVYGRMDFALNCNATYESVIYDQFYTIVSADYQFPELFLTYIQDGFPQVFLCFGDVACYYDAKKAPARNEKLPLWQFRWGSQQMGITPGHVMMLLMWDKIGDLPKRKEIEDIPGPKLRLTDGLQIPLLGQQQKGL